MPKNIMMPTKIKTALFSAVCAAVISLPAQADVIELSLILDGSGSMGSEGFKSQTKAYENIFSTDFYDNFITGDDVLYVNAFQFSSDVEEEIEWTKIDSNESAAAFGAQFADIAWNWGITNTALAIDTAVDAIVSNEFSSDRKVIDISTDGNPYVSGTPTSTARANALASAANAALQDITVNAIGMGRNISETFLDDLSQAGNGFYALAPDFDAFEGALAQKLYREINVHVPEPATAALFSLGLLGLFVSRRRKVQL